VSGAPVFVVPRELLEAAGHTVTLDGPEGHHAAAVQRLRAGESLVLTDGAGRRAQGRVRSTARGSLVVELLSADQVPQHLPRLVVVQALLKGDRGELAVETMTEVGVDVIVPWAASRCVVRWQGDRRERALTKWRTTGREAAKQARRTWFPEIAPLASTADVCELVLSAAAAAVLHQGATVPLSRLALPSDGSAGDVVLVVGPEGGLSDDEVAAFEGAGAPAYRLGETVLRASTAGAAALSVLQPRLGRW
jgi:16S rRNA (uracil1498-N3)-methyltransferase